MISEDATHISDKDATELYNICKNITIPLLRFKKYNNGKTDSRMGRARQFGDHRSALLGYVYPRFKPRSEGPKLSRFSIKHPELYECLIKISKKYFSEHKWTSIQLNHNVTCTPHKDKHNNGPSIIFGIGDYTGSKLVIEMPEKTLEIDIHNTIVEFEGSKYIHYNTPLISGEKYSFVFYA